MFPVSFESGNISTHSLTRRLTRESREHTRSRLISTHSLTRRLTISTFIIVPYLEDFNSQPHKEADGGSLSGDWKYDIFQLTASQGG